MEQVKYNEEFYAAFDGSVLIKAEEEGGKWIVYLQASNEHQDQDSEVMVSDALKKARDYYLQHGVISWDHKHKALHDPEFIIGEPTEVAFTPTGETLVKGWLYQKNAVAQKVWNNIQSGAKRLGASVGGGILKKSDNRIEQVIWDETAITHKPVNDGTLGHVQLIPFEVFAKALMAGSGVDASQFAGGRALSAENLEQKVADATFGQTDVPANVTYEEARRFFDGVLAGVLKSKIASMNDVVSYTLDQGYDDSVAASLIDFVARKVPNLR